MKYWILALGLTAGAAQAATGTDPNWPCIQRKQPHLSLGQMWSGPVPDDAIKKLSRDSAIAALADRLEQRRLPIQTATAEIAEYAKGADNRQLTALMLALFDRVDPDRARLIAGIARYGNKQVDLAKRIEEDRASMAQLEQAQPPDFDAIDAKEKQLDWDMRIFQDRQQALTYVCETPVLLEQRIFALARAIQAGLK